MVNLGDNWINDNVQTKLKFRIHQKDLPKKKKKVKI